MAETTISVMGQDLQGDPMSFSVRCEANQAIDTPSNIQIIGVADANSPKQLDLPKNMIVTDFIADAATGKFRIESNGMPTQIVIDLAAQQATSAGRPRHNIKLGVGKTYRFIVESTLPA